MLAATPDAHAAVALFRRFMLAALRRRLSARHAMLFSPAPLASDAHSAALPFFSHYAAFADAFSPPPRLPIFVFAAMLARMPHASAMPCACRHCAAFDTLLDAAALRRAPPRHLMAAATAVADFAA